MGLPAQTLSSALYAEADLDSALDIAKKSAFSFYTRNITHAEDESTNSANQPNTHETLIQKHYKLKTPTWMGLLETVPDELKKGPFQEKLEIK